jgi:hypothetical protein
MKRNSKIALAIAILAVVVIVSVAYFLPYLTPESIQVTPIKDTANPTTLGFQIDGHLKTRFSTFVMHYQTFDSAGNVIPEGGSIITTDFFGSYSTTTAIISGYHAGPVEIKITINESGAILQEDFNMTFQ